MEGDTIRHLYDDHRFLDAYEETREWWQAGKLPQGLTTSELVLAARLALRLGGNRVSNQLFRLAVSA